MAVFTHVDRRALAAFLAAYEVGPLLEARGIEEGVENTNYFVKAGRGTFILTLYENRVDPADLPFFLGLMRHVSARGLVCPQPVAGRDGKVLHRLAGKAAALFTFIEGRPESAPGPAHCAQLGHMLAQFHRACDGFSRYRRNALAQADWRGLVEPVLAKAERAYPGLEAEITGALDLLDQKWPAHLPQGVIHGDLFPDNVFFCQGRIAGLIDFYFACMDAQAYDLAICLNAWCFNAALDFEPEKAKALIDGYCDVRPLEGEERRALGILAMGAAMRFFVTRLHDWLAHDENMLVRVKDPMEYLARIRWFRAVGETGNWQIDS